MTADPRSPDTRELAELTEIIDELRVAETFNGANDVERKIRVDAHEKAYLAVESLVERRENELMDRIMADTRDLEAMYAELNRVRSENERLREGSAEFKRLGELLSSEDDALITAYFQTICAYHVEEDWPIEEMTERAVRMADARAAIWYRLTALRAENAELKSRALTPKEAAAILSVHCGYGHAGPVRPSDYDNGFAKLTALRSSSRVPPALENQND